MTRLEGNRIGLLTASASRLGGGVFEAVVAQAEMIRAAGGAVHVFALHDAQSDQDKMRFGPIPVTHCRVVGPRQIGFAPGLVDAMIRAELDCLHLHGIWMYPSAAGAAWSRQTGRPYLVSPHGMLDPWITARGRWKKALARAGYERASWRTAACLHALTEREARDIARESGRHDSLVIPNAGPEASGYRPARRGPRVLFLSRIHPKKNLTALLEAWSMLDATGALPQGAELIIAGWGEQGDVDAFKARLAQAPGSARFIGPAFGADKARELAAASFLILPSHSEGLPMAILEAWAAGTPTLMTAECNLPEGLDAGAALDCGYEADSIAACLTEALTMPPARWQQMSQAATTLAAERFAPHRIAERWAQAYASLIANSGNPRR